MPPNEIISDVNVVERPREIENQFYNLDSNKAQLLMLLQMQQMVQKMEEYERAQKLQKEVALPYECSIHTPSQKLPQMSGSEVQDSSKKIADHCTTHRETRSETSSVSKQPLIAAGDALSRKRAQSEPCLQKKPVLSSLGKFTH